MPRYELVRAVKPSLLERLRSITLGPFNPKDKTIAKYFGGTPSSTGVSVSETSALNYSAVWAALQLVGGDVASQPLKLYRRLRDGGKEAYESHQLYRILHDSPNPEMTSYTFRETLQVHTMSWGNGFAEIERDGAGRPRYLWPITPDRVTVEREGGLLAYRVENSGRSPTYLDPMNMLHIPGLGYDGTVGYGVIAKARESIGLGIAAERFGGTFYGNGSTFGGVFSTEKSLKEDQRKNFRDSINARHKGVDKANQFLLVEDGMTFTKLGIPPDDAQFLETRQFQVTEIARWFGVPPHKIGDLARATFSNIEQQNIEYYQNTLIHWLVRWEQQLMLKLISPLERNQQFIEFVTDGILRGDSAGRAALESAEFNIGGVTPNEVRGLSNRNPVEGGDRAFVQLNMVPLDKVDAWFDAEIDAKKAEAEAKRRPPPLPPTPPKDDAADREALRTAVSELKAALEREATEKRSALQKVEDLSGALAQMEDRAEQAEANHTQALEHLDGAQTALAAEQAERAIEQATAADTIAELRGQLEGATVNINEALADLIAERGKVAAAIVERDTERERAASAEAARDAKVAECAESEAALTESRQAAAFVTSRWESTTTELLTEREKVAAGQLALTAQTTDYEERFEQLRQAAQSATEARDEAIAHRHAAQANESLHLQRVEQADRDKAIAEQAQQSANLAFETLRATQADRLTGMLSATRALVVEAMGRILRRETEKAKRNQATPEKLRHWVDQFYVLHEDISCEILRPAVRVHLSLIGSSDDVQTVTLALVREHIAESMTQLRAAAASEPSEFQSVLARVLTRWETQRPEALADRLLKEGVDHVRSIQ